MTDTELRGTTPRPAAPWVTWGLALVLVGPAIYALGLSRSTDYEYGSDPGQAWMIVGGVVGVVGVFLLSVGVFYLVQHADRAAGVRYPSEQLRER